METRLLNIRLLKRDYDEFTDYCKSEGFTKSEVLRRVIKSKIYKIKE